MFLFTGLLTLVKVDTMNADRAVTFARSCGKDDSYMNLYYQMLLRKSDEVNSHWFKYIFPRHPATVLENLERLYLLPNLPTEEVRIPKIIHQIWVGPKPFPHHYGIWQETWKGLGWEYYLWTDKEVADLEMTNRELYEQEANYGAKADIARIEILHQFGGLYVDVDFECLQPESFEDLHRSYDFYCGMTPLDCKSFVLNNALIGSIPGHPILTAIIEELPHLYAFIAETTMTWSDSILLKGPGLFTTMFIDHADHGYHDIAFPPGYFYPLGVFQSKNQKFFEKYPEENFFEEVKNQVKKPETLAIHWWEGSWVLEKK